VVQWQRCCFVAALCPFAGSSDVLAALFLAFTPLAFGWFDVDTSNETVLSTVTTSLRR